MVLTLARLCVMAKPLWQPKPAVIPRCWVACALGVKRLFSRTFCAGAAWLCPFVVRRRSSGVEQLIRNQ